MARPPDPLGTPVRRAALRLLDAVLRRGEPLESALAMATRALPGGPDRGLAHAIAAETLRRLTDLDALIDLATRQRLPDDAKARAVLRIALVQALVLGTPPHAAIATALPLVDGGPKRLVHSVFGTLMRADARLPDPPTLPADVAARWQAAWGDAAVAAAAQAIAAPPPLDLAFRSARAATAFADAHGGVSLAPGHVRVADAAPVPDLPGYADGDWWVQDIAATLPARLIGTGSGTVFDLCAAPGGKTCQLAAAGWDVVAVDSSQSRAARLRENLARTRLSAEVVIADALDWSPAAPRRRGAARRAVQRDRHLPPPSRRALPRARSRHRRAGRGPAPPARARRRLGAAGRHARLCHLFAGAGRGRGADRSLPRRTQ